MVISSSAVTIPPQLQPLVETSSLAPAKLLAHFPAAYHVYVDGGQTVQSFLRAGLIDELIITRLPVLLGDGISLFGPLPTDVRLVHLCTKSYPNGAVQSQYRVVKTG